MTRAGSENVSDRRQVVVQDASRDKDAGRAIRIGRDAVELSRDLQSDNYEPGQSGWRLNRETGDLEANSGTFRGDLEAVGGTFTGTLSGVGGTFTGNLSASQITSGTLDANNVTISNLTVGFAQVTGTLSASRIVGGTFQGRFEATDGISGSGAGMFFSDPAATGPIITFQAEQSMGILVAGQSHTVLDTSIHSHGPVPSGSRTTDSINWIGASGGPNGETGRESPRNTTAHTHEVQFHTHTITI